MAPSPGWQRRTSLTRTRIADAGLALFVRRGYERVSMADIAAAAGVSERTVFRYYPAKVDLAFGDEPGEIDRFVDALRAAPASLTITGAVLHAIEHASPTDPDVIARDRLRFELIRSTPALAAAWSAAMDASTPDFAAWLAERMGVAADDIAAHAAAAALLAAHRVVMERWDGRDPAAYGELSGRALAVLADGLGQYDGAPTTVRSATSRTRR